MEVLESQDLSDGQIQQLLRDAEQRMRASTEAGANTLITTSGVSSLPGLDSRYIFPLTTRVYPASWYTC
jgi:hypothetical protein